MSIEITAMDSWEMAPDFEELTGIKVDGILSSCPNCMTAIY
jgi:hypothetical protein